jgi:hypothetical protein
MLKDAGLEGKPDQDSLRMHDLRHTLGTLMANAGEDTTVIQKALGHARQSITADLYIGQIPNALRVAADRLDALLDPASADDPPGHFGSSSFAAQMLAILVAVQRALGHA